MTSESDDELLEPPREVTTADLAADAETLSRERQALEPVKTALEARGYYAYATLDDQRRWTIAVDDEAGRVDVRIGADGFEVELWGSSPGLYSDEENEWRRRVHERVARMALPAISRGVLAPHQTATWDEFEQGVTVRIHYELPFQRGDQIGDFVQQRLPELDEVIALVESRLAS